MENKYSLLDFLIITLKDSSPDLLDFAKQFIPLGDAVKIDLDVLSAKFKELEKLIKTLETDLKVAKDFIQNLKESDGDEASNNSKEEIIKSCSKFYDKFDKIYFESNEMFTDLNNDFTDVQNNLKSEGKKFGEDDDMKIVEFVDCIYKFGKEFNEALKTMVVQERINKKKQKKVANNQPVKSIKIDLNTPQRPHKSSFKTLAQLNQERSESKKSRYNPSTKKDALQPELAYQNSIQDKSKRRILQFSRKEFAQDTPYGSNLQNEAKTKDEPTSPCFGAHTSTTSERQAKRCNIFGSKTKKHTNLFKPTASKETIMPIKVSHDGEFEQSRQKYNLNQLKSDFH